MAIFWHEDGPLLFFPMAPDRARVITSLGPSTGEPPVALEREAFQKILDVRGPGGITLTGTEWISAAFVHSTPKRRDGPNPKLLYNSWLATDGIRASSCQHPVQYRHADGSLGPLGGKAVGSQPWSDQPLVAAHRGFY